MGNFPQCRRKPSPSRCRKRPATSTGDRPSSRLGVVTDRIRDFAIAGRTNAPSPALASRNGDFRNCNRALPRAAGPAWIRAPTRIHMANKDTTDPARMEKIVSLCKRRGFIFQAGELYGGLNGCWDYGPLGAELKRNLKEYWWRKTVQERDDVLGMDGAILTMEQVLVSSGHVGGFSDPMCDCLLSKARLRADQIPAQDGTAVYFSGAKHHGDRLEQRAAVAVLVATGKEPVESATKPRAKFYAEFMPDKRISPKELELPEERREELTGTTGSTRKTAACSPNRASST